MLSSPDHCCCLPRTMTESVANVNEASLPTGKVSPAAYSEFSDMRIGSAKGSLPGIVDSAIGSCKK